MLADTVETESYKRMTRSILNLASWRQQKKTLFIFIPLKLFSYAPRAYSYIFDYLPFEKPAFYKPTYKSMINFYPETYM